MARFSGNDIVNAANEWCITLRKHAYSNILKISHPKTESFSDKNSDIFHISAQNIDCGYSLEPPRFWAEIRKIMYTPVNPSFSIYKWGVRGPKLYRHVFVMTLFQTEHSISYKTAYAQRRLGSACAAAPAHQSLLCPPEDALDPSLHAKVTCILSLVTCVAIYSLVKILSHNALFYHLVLCKIYFKKINFYFNPRIILFQNANFEKNSILLLVNI